MTKHPIQAVVDVNGVLRFKQNAVVRFLIENGSYGMNELARMVFSDDDRQQFAQLIGYSLDGYGTLGYADPDVLGAACEMAEGAPEAQARIDHLQGELDALRAALREPMARLFDVHPDDLGTPPTNTGGGA